MSEFRKKPSDDYDIDENMNKMTKTHGSNNDAGGNNNDIEDISQMERNS
jgi:hypothetical protein